MTKVAGSGAGSVSGFVCLILLERVSLFLSAPMDYEKFDLENLSLQDAISGITDFESSDLIFLEPGTFNPAKFSLLIISSKSADP